MAEETRATTSVPGARISEVAGSVIGSPTKRTPAAKAGLDGRSATARLKLRPFKAKRRPAKARRRIAKRAPTSNQISLKFRNGVIPWKSF